MLLQWHKFWLCKKIRWRENFFKNVLTYEIHRKGYMGTTSLDRQKQKDLMLCLLKNTNKCCIAHMLLLFHPNTVVVTLQGEKYAYVSN